jgi:hypothetical protein
MMGLLSAIKHGVELAVQAQHHDGKVRHDETLSDHERSKLGAHYTPSDWARRIVSTALCPLIRWQQCPACCLSESLLDLQVIDPSCGDGVFLDAAADALGAMLFQAYQIEGQDVGLLEARRRVLRSCIVGVDIDPGAIAAARRRLGTDPELVCADALLDWRFDTRGRPTAFVGNPPFLGGRKISTLLGTAYPKQLSKRYAEWTGSADLCAFFFLLAADVMRDGGSHGTISFIATSSISEGATRLTALHPLVADRGCVIYEATRRVPWPGKASVSVSVVHLAELRLAWKLWASSVSDTALPEIVRDRIRFPKLWPPDPVRRQALVQLQRKDAS